MIDNEIAEIVSLAKPQGEKQVDPDIQAIAALAPKEPVGIPHPNLPKDELSWGEALTEGFSNIPSSGWQYAKDTASAIIHPKETLSSLKQLAESVSSKLVPGKQKNEELVDAVMDFYKERYSTPEGFKKSFAENPVSVLADFASILSLGGSAVGATGKLTGIKQILDAGKKTSRFGAKLEPLNLAWQIAKQPMKLIPEKVPVEMYRRAAKFSHLIPDKRRNELSKIGLQQEMIIERGGLNKIQEGINNLNVEITKKLNRAAYTGEKIDINRLYDGLDDGFDSVAAKLRRQTDEPLIVDAKLAEMKKNLVRHLESGNLKNPQDIQKIKQNIYKDLKSLYDQTANAPVKGKMRQHLAKMAKEALEDIIPEIKDLNFDEGELIAFYEAIEARANAVTNRDFASFGLAMKMGTGAGLGGMIGKAVGSPTQGATIGSVLGLSYAIYETPQVKSRLAILINNMRSKGVKINNLTALTKLGLYKTSEIEKELLDEGGGS